MELEQRMETLEHELKILKGEIRGTLLDVRENLAQKPPNPSRWQKRAWGMALLNILLALTLFTNVRLYTSDIPVGVSATLVPWLRGFWVALAFVWLLLQMYPLALLLDQEEPRPREMAWHNAARIFASNPTLTLALTLLVLTVAVISMLFPSLWFMLTVALLAVACANGMLYLLRLYQRQTQGVGKRH